MYCQNCGKEVTGKFCMNCGAAVPNSQPINTPQQSSYQQTTNSQPVYHPLQNLQQPPVIINNTNLNQVTAGVGPRPKDKWVAVFLCFFLGVFGAHKFYEGKILLGIIYALTGGLLLVGWIIDLIAILCKPNPYYV